MDLTLQEKPSFVLEGLWYRKILCTNDQNNPGFRNDANAHMEPGPFTEEMG